MIYLDNAATSWPKPEGVAEAMRNAVTDMGGNPGRSGHKMSLQAGGVVEQGRFLLAQMFHVSDPNRIIFTMNATDALNMAIRGILKDGGHVVTSCMEHNSVVRPLAYKAQHGVKVEKVQTDPETGVCPDTIREAICKDTKLVVITHASNVIGTLNNIAEIAEVCREKKVPILVDASQSAGVIDINVEKMGIDMLAFPGHKGLLGPRGTGGLYVSSNVDLAPFRAGGTGVRSEEILMPDEMPWHLEAGTQNVPGIAGLSAGLSYILQTGIDVIRQHEMHCIRLLLEGLAAIPGIIIYGPQDTDNRAAVLSFNVAGLDSSDMAMILDTSFDIAVRAGLHCAPDTHKMLGTFAQGGTVRVSPGCFTTEEEIEQLIEAVGEIAASLR